MFSFTAGGKEGEKSANKEDKRKIFFTAFFSFVVLLVLNILDVKSDNYSLEPFFRLFEGLSAAVLFYLSGRIKNEDAFLGQKSALFLFSLLAAYRFIYFYSNNINEVPFYLAFLIIFASIAIFYLIFFFFKFATGNGGHSLVVSLFLMYFLTADIQNSAFAPAFFGAALFLSILTILFVNIEKFVYFLKTFTLVLIGLCVLNGGFKIASSCISSNFASFGNLKKGEFEINKKQKRDIYIILLDMYSGSRALNAIGFDNSYFYNGLKDRGFAVYKDIESNYSKTVVSLSSFLNFSYVEDLPHKTPADAVSNAKIFNIAKQAGYKIYYLNSWPLDFHVRQGTIDKVYESTRGTNASVLKFFLGESIISKAIFDKGISFGNIVPALNVVDFLISKAPESGRRLVFAHLLMPHPPYLYDEFGNKTKNGIFDLPIIDGTKLNADNYLGFLKFTNAKVFEIVDKILAKKGEKPIILVMGDHGPRMVEYLNNHEKYINEIEKNYKYCFNTFLAYYNPDLEQERSMDEKSLINFSINFVNENFGTSFKNVEDKHFYVMGTAASFQKAKILKAEY